MKRFRRILLRVFAGLAVLILTGLVVSLDTVDDKPYLREPYYAETTARLRARLATNTVARGELAVGFGRALLTPTVNAPQDAPAQGEFRMMPLAGYGSRQGKPATGVHDDLYIKAVALRVGTCLGVMVGADALIIPPEVASAAVQQLEQEAKLSREPLQCGHIIAAAGDY